MGTYTDIGSITKKLDRLAKTYSDAQSLAVNEMLKLGVVTAKRFGGRYHIKGRSGRGVQLGAKAIPSKTSAATGKAYGVLIATPQGLWKLVEKGAKPHAIYPRRRGRRGSGTKGALYGGYGHPVRYVHHPGTHGSIGHPWEQTVTTLERLGPSLYAKGMSTAFLKAVA